MEVSAYPRPQLDVQVVGCTRVHCARVDRLMLVNQAHSGGVSRGSVYSNHNWRSKSQ